MLDPETIRLRRLGSQKIARFLHDFTLYVGRCYAFVSEQNKFDALVNCQPYVIGKLFNGRTVTIKPVMGADYVAAIDEATRLERGHGRKFLLRECEIILNHAQARIEKVFNEIPYELFESIDIVPSPLEKVLLQAHATRHESRGDRSKGRKAGRPGGRGKPSTKKEELPCP
ncbi:hypothetical protein [Desulfonatronum thiosulfatophilum]|nr:hypothetical protein [Desulfonatronum thiosulfatophilum]